ncbi:MAG: DUF3352 domain-containing protein [Candidatus Limnocylindrales bacterium]
MTDDRTIEQGPDPQPAVGPPAADVTEPAIAAEAAVPPDAPTVARAAQPSDAPGAAAYEASVEPIATAGTPTAPVAVSPVRRPSRARWGVAGLVALVVVALSAAGLFTLVGASSNAVVASWTPADAVVYVEVRGDLPGDQRQNLGRFLAHFPGFADQATLDAKLDETLDKIVNKASDNKHDWTREIKPWFGGQVAVSVSSLPTPSSDGSAGGADSTRALLVVTQKDPAAAIAWLKSLALGPTTDETYKGVALTIYTPGSGPKIAATATGGVLLVGDEASVKAALDRDGKDGLGASKAFTSAMAGISGDQVTRTYVDLKAYFDAMAKLTDSLGGAGSMLDKTMLDKLPAWVAFGGRIESDALVSDLVSPVVASAPEIDDHESTIAGHLPASTVALLEVHQFDKLFTAQLDQLRANPSTADTLKQVDDAAATLGGLDHLVGWIGDVGVVVTSDGTTPGGGLVIVPTDAAAADKVVTELRNLVALAGSSSGITTRDEAYGAGTITTIDFGDLSKLTGGGGAALGLPLTGHAELSYTVQGGVVIVGVGPTWVKSIVDVKAGGSLADQARYKDAIGRVESKNASSLFVDLAAIRKLAEPVIAKLPSSNYATEIKPYVQPFDVFVLTGWTDGEVNRARYVLTVTNP